MAYSASREDGTASLYSSASQRTHAMTRADGHSVMQTRQKDTSTHSVPSVVQEGLGGVRSGQAEEQKQDGLVKPQQHREAGWLLACTQ